MLLKVNKLEEPVNSTKKYCNKKNLYKCNHCGKIVKRNSDKKWIKSYCEQTGKMVHIVKVEKYKRRN